MIIILCDDIARWWLEWHKCKLDQSNTSVHGARMLFSPSMKPNPKQFML